MTGDIHARMAAWRRDEEERTRGIVAALLRSPATAAWFDLGYIAGWQHGIAEGRRLANQEWTLTTSAACRAGLELMKAGDAQRYRRKRRHSAVCPDRLSCGGECLPKTTGSDLVRAARRSWAEVEASIRGRRAG